MRTPYLLPMGLSLLLAWLATGGVARAQCTVTPVIGSVTRNPSDPARVYALANLVEGDFYFTDRNTPGSHILVSIPSAFRCAQWVKTPNDDKEETSTSLVQLQLSQRSVVYVGLDNRAASGPAWLTGGGFGPEGGVLATLTILGATTAALRWQRKDVVA